MREDADQAWSSARILQDVVHPHPVADQVQILARWGRDVDGWRVMCPRKWSAPAQIRLESVGPGEDRLVCLSYRPDKRQEAEYWHGGEADDREENSCDR